MTTSMVINRLPALTPDYAQDQIRKVRDLEDFTRLDLYLGGLQEAIRNRKIRVRCSDGGLTEVSPVQAFSLPRFGSG